MSLVNSLINQVGREMGRDLYWSTKQTLLSGGSRRGFGSARARNQVQVSTNQELFSLVGKKKWSNKMRFPAVKQDIIETIEIVDDKIDPRSFDWREVYAELDNRIDDLKLASTDEEAPELEELDKKNFVSYSISLARHKTWLEQMVENDEKSVATPSKGTIFFLSFFGLTSKRLRRGSLNAVAEVFCALVWWCFFSFGVFKLRQGGDDKVGLSLVAIGVGFYLIVLAGDFIALNEIVKTDGERENRRNQLKNYLVSLNHSL